jgi:integrase
MKGLPQPFFRNSVRCWYVKINGRQVRLHPDRAQSYALFYKLMSESGGEKTSDLQVSDIVNKFLAELALTKSASTHRWYVERFRTFVKHFASRPAGQVKPTEVLLEVHKQDWTDNTKSLTIRAVKCLYKWATINGLIDTNPMQHMVRPPERARDTCVTPEQMTRIEEHVKDGPFKDLIRLAWDTGMRPEELFRLEAGFVVDNGQRIEFPVAMSKKKIQRTVFVGTDRSAELLLRLKSQFPAGALLRNTHGQPWCKNAVNCAFQRLRKAVGFPVHLGAFRKGYCTEALKSGLDTVTVAHLMGHVNAVMVSRVYGKVAQDRSWMAEAAKKAKRS